MNLKLVLACLLLISLTACSQGDMIYRGQQDETPAMKDILAAGPDQASSLEAQARAVLVDFYDVLNQGAYDQAALLYGGSYDMLQDFNPEIDPGDKLSLLRAGCVINGLMCLPVLNLSFVQVNDQQEFVYEVVFANRDGSEFVLGPCCGATEEEMPPVSEFFVRVTCTAEGACHALDLPPYVP